MPQTRQYGHPFLTTRVPQVLKDRIGRAASEKGYAERERSEFVRLLLERGLAAVDDIPAKPAEAQAA